MKKSKIIITFTLIITSLFLSGCGIFTKSKSNGLIFRDIDSNTCEVIGYEEPISKKIFGFIPRLFTKEQGVDIVIPSEYKGKKVVSIGEGAFADFYNLKSIVIPESVISIGGYSFYKCNSLESITLPFIEKELDKTTKINFGYIFGDDVPISLKEVIITGGTSIGYGAFEGCSSLESIVIPESVTSIKKDAFRGCSSLESIVIPESVTSIKEDVFSGCSSLESIVISKSVISIGENAFENCKNLENVYYNDEIKDWCNIKFSNFASNPMYYAKHFYMKNSNNRYYEVTEIQIPKTLTSIEYQFRGFDYIEKVVIPESVISITSGAFRGCSNLESVVIPESVTSIGSSVFSGCDRLIIYCETESQPSGWNSNWNSGARPVIWGYRN